MRAAELFRIVLASERDADSASDAPAWKARHLDSTGEFDREYRTGSSRHC